jgi:NifU-like protein involved in Fe-S cluster formation
MSETLMVDAVREPTVEEVADLKAAIQQMFKEMEQIDTRIESRLADVEKLKAETRATLADLRAAA